MKIMVLCFILLSSEILFLKIRWKKCEGIWGHGAE